MVSTRVLTISVLLALAGAVPARAEPASLPDVLVTPGQESRSFQTPQLAVDPTKADRLAIAYVQGEGHDYCALARSRDGGKTWENERVVGRGTPYPMPENYEQCYDPMVAYGPNGTLYYEYQNYPGTNPLGQRKTFITAFRAGGPAETPKEIDPPDPGANDRTDLYSEMVVDGRSGRVYVSWARFCEPSAPGPGGLIACLPDPGQFQVTSSADGARSFAEPVTVNPPSSPDPGRSSIGVDAAGTVYAAWIDGFLTAGRPGAPPPNLFAATSRDQGKSFGQPFRIAQTKPCSGRLCYSPDAGSGGFIHVVGGAPGHAFLVGWEKRDNDKNRLVFTRTGDGGTTWSPPRVVGIPPGGQDHEQHHPRMAVSPQGRIYIVYYDFRPEGDGGFHNAYLIDSSDGGRSFSTPRKLSDAPSNAQVGPFFHGAEQGQDLANFGQRLGIATTRDGGPLTAWTDSRRGTSVSGKQDIFFEGQSLEAAGQGPAGGQGRRCVSTRGGIKGTGVGVARLGRTRAGQRKVLKGTLFSDRPKIDRYCVKKGGGSLRAGYPTRRLASKLSRRTRRRIGSKAILLVSTSKAFKLSRSKVGTRTRTLRRRLKGERRFKVGRNLWYVAKGRKARLLFRTRKGKVLEMGIADKRLTTTRRATVRLLRAWDKRGKTRK